jgi:hypothetical protein
MSTHTKRLGVTVAIIAALTLGACGGGGSSKPAAVPKHPATSYVAPKVTAPHGTDPVALARTLGCTDPTVSTIGAISGFPVPSQHVRVARQDRAPTARVSAVRRCQPLPALLSLLPSRSNHRHSVGA